MSRANGEVTERMTKFLHEEAASGAEQIALRAIIDAAEAAHLHTGVYDPAGSASTAQSVSIQRGNHTGTQTLSTISDAGTAAAAATGDFATAAQGVLAGTATQPADLTSLQSAPSEGEFQDGDKTKLDAITGTNTGDQDLVDTFGFACSDEATLLTSGEKIVFYAPYAFTITAIYASLNTAPTVQAVTVDVEFPAGTSLLTSVLSIGTAAFTDEETGMSKVITKGDRISIDIDQIDTAGAAAGLKIFITHTRT